MSETTIESSKILESLRTAVKNALKKKRLGQYAVIWKDNAPQKVKGSEILSKN